MTILVTRPQAEGITLCQQLNESGMKATHHPLLTLTAGSEPAALISAIHTCDILICVSQHAVHFSGDTLCNFERTSPNKIAYYAVGQKTADALMQKVRTKIHTPVKHDSEHLLALNSLQQVKDKNVLILRGNGGRDLIFDTLLQRQAQVRYLEMYQRHPISFDGKQCVLDWKRQEISQIVVTSSEQLHYLYTQIPVQYRAWLCSRSLFVPSRRISDQAQQLGFLCITNTESAANSALFYSLREHLISG